MTLQKVTRAALAPHWLEGYVPESVHGRSLSQGPMEAPSIHATRRDCRTSVIGSLLALVSVAHASAVTYASSDFLDSADA